MEKHPRNHPKSEWDSLDDGLPSYGQAETSQLGSVKHDLPSYEEATEGKGKSREPGVGAACSHYLRSRCQMTLNPRRCCACTDQRPETESSLYSVYIPSKSRVEKVPRWEFYCPGCREYFDPKAEIRSLQDQMMWKEKRARSLAQERDQKYWGLGGWVHADQHAEAYHANIRKEVKNFIPKGQDKEWRVFTPWDAVLPVITKSNVRAFLGSQPAEDEVFVDVAATYVTNSIDYTFELAQVPSFLQPFIYKFLPGYDGLGKQYKEGEKVVRAMMEEKKARNLASLSNPPSVFDYINAEGKHLDDVGLQMDIQLPLCAASIHTTTTTITQCIFDLSGRPQYIPELRDEALQVLEINNGSLAKQALVALEKLDSFIKEVQRLCSPDLTTFQRKALAPVTLSNGFRIPKDIQIEVATGAINADSTIYEKPDQFDGLRAYKKRKTSEDARNRHQVLSVSKEDLTWGFGRAACPGRFLAEMQIKMVLVEILISCELKMPDSQGRYENFELRGQTLLNVQGQILVRPR
ncbi:cytochrome P450 [Xylariaceae sp. FL0662B]|nr:cytochrome P450 [Xylariaceae sp. FL0662B]